MKLNYNLFFIILLLLACKKNTVSESIQTPEAPPTSIPNEDTSLVPPITGKTIIVGTGSGNLVINGATLKLGCGDRIKITKGAYKSINIQNIQSTDGCPIMIINGGLVELKGNNAIMNLTNLKNVIISGTGDPTIKYGFQFHDNAYRSILISRPYNNATIQNASFKNIKDWVIIYNNQNTKYDGTEASYSKNLKFLNIYAENTARLINFPGSAEWGAMNGLIKGLEIANLEYNNSPTVGSIAWVGNVEDYSIHHNRVNNINSANNEHNGIFQMMGNGKFYNNYISNHQGNAIRAWCYSIGTTKKEILIYNNIVVNSRKYSAFEVQTVPAYVTSGLTYVNVKVFNNTCGNLNTTKQWYGNLVDVYSLQGGTCQVFNNIGFNFPASNPFNKTINQQGVTKSEDLGNLYFATSNDVGFSSQTTWRLNSNSKAKNKGRAHYLVVRDYYETLRNAISPSYGAVE
ncbi:hypothetical protein [Pedobacter sp. B4-66]|uniref:hypothetical protein n=1 Tax=Pedobacter sp. B4-66 TaxID=2817280 RepID=UPI001BDAA1BE|nr:hypothetical protein [Pedobacter sp. B4-66]